MNPQKVSSMAARKNLRVAWEEVMSTETMHLWYSARCLSTRSVLRIHWLAIII